MGFLAFNETNLRKLYYEDKLTQQECADLFGYSKRTIQSYFKKWNLVGRKERNDKWKQRISKKLVGNKNGLGIEFTEERKQKISKALKGTQNCLGRVLSEKTKSKIAKAHLKENLSYEALEAYRESAIKRIERQLADGQVVTPSIGLKEKDTIDEYEKLLDCKFERQYRVAGFFIDGYCIEKNIAIEVDEDYHRNREERDIYREEIIKRELGCKIIRVRV